MSRIAEAEVFVAVVEAGGFTAAALRLGVSQSAVSRRIAALEARLGVRLLTRSTRKLRPTDAGYSFYQRCRSALGALDEAESDAAAEGSALRGVLRVTGPPAFGRAVLVPLLAEFSSEHPAIRLDLMLTEQQLDLAEERIHLAVRFAAPGTRADLIHTRLGSFTMIPCAAPGYLEKHGTPHKPDDLRRHACLVQTGGLKRDTWRFERGDNAPLIAVDVNGPFHTNDVDALRRAACAGIGVGLLPDFLVEADVRAGSLRRVLPRFSGPRVPIFAVYSQRRHLPARVRALLDFLIRSLRGY
jgi:DNA-binding transcriptional LysR family regulator